VWWRTVFVLHGWLKGAYLEERESPINVEEKRQTNLICIARGETLSLLSYDKNVYVQSPAFDKQSMEDLLAN
jgi:hypothetical protein